MNDHTSFERRLSGLFDRQRFFRDPALDSLISETESRCFGGRALTDDELDMVSAAGESDPLQDDIIEDETMLIIPVESQPIKIIHQIVITDGPPDSRRKNP